MAQRSPGRPLVSQHRASQQSDTEYLPPLFETYWFSQRIAALELERQQRLKNLEAAKAQERAEEIGRIKDRIASRVHIFRENNVFYKKLRSIVENCITPD